MRLIHTSDWHVGALLHGRDRSQELAVFLEELGTIVRDEAAEAVLISGDLFDQPNPPAEAEKLVFDFFRKMAERKISVVLIAGNHDSGARIEGKARLLELVEIHAFGIPHRQASVEIRSKSGERLIVAALPFTGEWRMLEWDETFTRNPSQQKSMFAERMKNLLSTLSKTHFKPDAVNILMAHLTINGAFLSGTEKNIRMSDAWTIPSAMLPKEADYIALGHIHKQQKIPDAPVPTAYAGSPLYIDFGEEKDEKGVYVIEASPGRPIKLALRKLEKIIPVKTLRTTLKELEFQSKVHKDFTGHLKVELHLEAADKKSGMMEEVRRLLPQSLVIHRVDPPKSRTPAVPYVTTFLQDPIEAYRTYLESEGRKPTPDLIQKLEEFIEEASHAPS